jgi:FeS assembly SUF system regulator
MFRLNRLTDYAVVMMSQMALAEGRTRSAQQLSDDTALPLPTVAKITNALAKAGVIESQRGAAGGYSLARDAEDISIAEIIQALEGPIALTACVDGAEATCEVERLCPMSGGWNKVNLAIRGALEGVTLADMSQLPQGFVPVDDDAENNVKANA